MALGISLLITAVGAILRYAYTPTYSHGFNWSTAGGILMIIGIVGAVLSVVVWVSRTYSRQRTTSVTQGPNGQLLRRDDVDSTTTMGV
jgi:uncharacterized membrane protein